MLSKTVVKARPSVLWCYKKELYLSSHKKKRMQQIKKMAEVRGSSAGRDAVAAALCRGSNAVNGSVQLTG